MRFTTPILLFVVLVAICSRATSQDLSATEYTYKNINAWHNSIDSLLTKIDQAEINVTDEFLVSSTVALEKYRDHAQSCLQYLEKNIEDIESELAVIGESPDQDTSVVAIARQSLEKEQLRHQRKLKSCKLLTVKTEKIDKWLTSQTQKKETQKRLYQSYTLVDIVKHFGELELLSYVGRSIQSLDFGLGAFSSLTWLFCIAGLAMICPMLFLLYKNRGRFFGATPLNYITHQTFFYFFTNNHVLLVLLAIVAYLWGFVLAWGMLSSVTIPLQDLLFILVQGFLLLCITNAIFSGKNESGSFIVLPKNSLKEIRRHTRFLIVYYNILSLFISWPGESEINQVSKEFIRFIFLSFFAFSLAKVIWHLVGYSIIKTFRPIKYLVPPASIIASLALLTGYFNFIEFVCLKVTYSYFILLGGYFLYRVLTDFFDSLDEGRYQWQKNLKSTLDIPKSEIVPGVIWLRIFVVIFTYFGAAIFLLNQWTSSAITTEKLINYISSGIEVGQISIVPMQIFQSLIFIAISMSVLLWTRKQFELRVLSKSRMDVGARDALGSILMYSLGLLAILIAISIAGVNLGNIAIIAGALSVGIGFGLQAIVNNFVSGLILLLERPIQKGDWVVVDETEGYVKRISVRSTLIQTFDHADVIVPNSDLITHVVKNWTLKNHSGRICIPVGVSYNCDVEKAKNILLDIAQNRPETSKDPYVAPPRVLLLEFGESSVELELRFFTSIINDSLSIASDVRFEILKRFKEEDIEIPFPQRVMHMPNVNRTEE